MEEIIETAIYYRFRHTYHSTEWQQRPISIQCLFVKCGSFCGDYSKSLMVKPAHSDSPWRMQSCSLITGITALPLNTDTVHVFHNTLGVSHCTCVIRWFVHLYTAELRHMKCISTTAQKHIYCIYTGISEWCLNVMLCVCVCVQCDVLRSAGLQRWAASAAEERTHIISGIRHSSCINQLLITTLKLFKRYINVRTNHS